MEFNQQAMRTIAQVLDVILEEAPYTVHGDPVFETRIRNDLLGQNVQLVFWPSIARVDAYVGDCQIIFKGITEMETLPGIEVIFRRPPTPGQLLITRAGRVAIAA
jgi:hypothetical protein